MSEPIYGIPPDLEVGAEAQFLPLAGEVNWGMAWEGLQQLRELAADGEGVTACVVDTGGTADQHPLLANIAAARDFTGSPRGAAAVHPHGAHCLGTVGATDPRIGVATRCRLVSGKGLGDSGSGPSPAITGGMRFGAEQGAEVISMSLGSSGEDRGITGLMRELAERGVWIVAAAGNSGPGTPDVDWPARSPHCVSVAALDQHLNPASFTNAGAKIDTAGPGVGIWSTVPGGRFQQMSGTSMATPYVAGVLVLYRAALRRAGLPIPTVAELRLMLRADSTDVHSPGVDRRTGPGALKAVLLALNLTPDPRPVV